MGPYANLPQLEVARGETYALQRRLACTTRDIRALECDMDQSVWSGKGRDGLVRLFRFFEQALDGMQATLDEKQALLDEAALEAGRCLQSETEGFCEEFTAAESWEGKAMKIELRYEALQLLHDRWGLLGEELREIWDGIQAVDEDLTQMFTGDMRSAYRAAAERSSAQASQFSDISESLLAQLDEVNHATEAFDRVLGTMIQRGGRKT